MRIDYGEYPNRFRNATKRSLGRAIAEESEAGYAKLVAAAPCPADARLRSHLYGYILPGLALYRALRSSGLGQAEALERIDRAFVLVMAPERRRMRALGRLPFFYALLKRFVKPFMRAYPASGWDTEWLEISGERVRFDMRRCYYHDTLRSLGASELTASFCKTDDLVYGGASPSYEWRRTMTIGRGDESCDFCFERCRAASLD